MPRYIDLNNPKIIHTGRDKFGNGIYHIPPDLPTADVVEKEWYDILLEHANILAEEMRKYQNADVPERNVGKWIDDCSCSICHWIHEDDKGFALLTNYNFCPNCGADMREEMSE